MIAREIVKFWLVSLNKKKEKKKEFMREEEEDDNLAINFNQSRVSTVGIRSKREKKKKDRSGEWPSSSKLETRREKKGEGLLARSRTAMKESTLELPRARKV